MYSIGRKPLVLCVAKVILRSPSLTTPGVSAVQMNVCTNSKCSNWCVRGAAAYAARPRVARQAGRLKPLRSCAVKHELSADSANARRTWYFRVWLLANPVKEVMFFVFFYILENGNWIFVMY